MARVMSLLALLLGTATIAVAGSYNYVEPAEFRQWLEKGKDVTVVDIQTLDEYKTHHFSASLETNAYPVKTADEKSKLDKIVPLLSAHGKDVVVVCPRGGGGAKNTYDYLKEKGVEDKRIYILRGGMQGWPYKELVTVSE